MLFSMIIRRVFSIIPTLLAISLIVFLVVKAIPGDPAQLLLGDKANQEALESLRAELGLDQPLYVQYGKFLHSLVIEGDLGRSITTSEPITEIIKEKFPATIELTIAAILIAMLIGIPLGIVAAVKKDSIFDLLAAGTSVMGVSMPVFWLGLILIWIFGLELALLPLSGRMGIEYDYEAITGFLVFDSIWIGDFEMAFDACRHLLLPACSLASIPMAFIARITRASMLDVLKEDFIRTARAKGLGEMAVIFSHTFRNSLPNIVTITGLQLGTLLAGAMITETVFSWPGIGTWILSSVSARDIPALEGGVLLVATTFIIVNLIVDILIRIFDPRVRVG